MKMTKDIALMAAGAASVIMYQKYNKQAMNKMQDAADVVMKKANKKLEDMM